MSECVVCGRKYDYGTEHHCPKAVSAAVDGAGVRDYDVTESRIPEVRRLADGFELMDDPFERESDGEAYEVVRHDKRADVDRTDLPPAPPVEPPERTSAAVVLPVAAIGKARRKQEHGNES